jgi:hypothetical protein
MHVWEGGCSPILQARTWKVDARPYWKHVHGRWMLALKPAHARHRHRASSPYRQPAHAHTRYRQPAHTPYRQPAHTRGAYAAKQTSRQGMRAGAAGQGVYAAHISGVWSMTAAYIACVCMTAAYIAYISRVYRVYRVCVMRCAAHGRRGSERPSSVVSERPSSVVSERPSSVVSECPGRRPHQSPGAAAPWTRIMCCGAAGVYRPSTRCIYDVRICAVCICGCVAGQEENERLRAEAEASKRAKAEMEARCRALTQVHDMYM